MNYDLKLLLVPRKTKHRYICLSWSMCLQILAFLGIHCETLTCPASLSSGASSATMLIFILPAAFYLKLVKKEPLRSPKRLGWVRLRMSPTVEEVRKHMRFRKKMKQTRPHNKTQELHMRSTMVGEERMSDIQRILGFQVANISIVCWVLLCGQVLPWSISPRACMLHAHWHPVPGWIWWDITGGSQALSRCGQFNPVC